MTRSIRESSESEGRIVKLNRCFCILSFLSLLGAKAFGLYDGQWIYNVLLVSGAVFFLLKLLVSRLTTIEWLGVILLLAMGGAVYWNTGEKGILLYLAMMLCVKNVSLREIFQWGAGVWTAGFTVLVFLTQMGLMDEIVYDHPKHFFGYVLCHGMGYSHPNVAQISYVVLIAFWLYFLDDILSCRQLLMVSGGLMLGNIWLFLNTMSYTGVALTSIYLVLNYILVVRGRRDNIVIGRGGKILLQMILPCCVLFSIAGPLILKSPAIYSRYPFIYNKINDLLNTRYDLSRYFLTEQPLTLFGTRFQVPNFRYTMDCSYVYLLMQCGIVPFAVIILGFLLLIHDYIQENKWKELAIILGFSIAGISEPFLFNSAYKNLIFLFLGEYFYRKAKLLTNQKPILAITPLRSLKSSFSQKNHVLTNNRLPNKGLQLFTFCIVIIAVSCIMFFHFLPQVTDIYIPERYNMDLSCSAIVLSDAEKRQVSDTGAQVLESSAEDHNFVIVADSTRQMEQKIHTLNCSVWTGIILTALLVFIRRVCGERGHHSLILR